MASFKKEEIKYSILQYVNQCWESVSERKHKRENLCSFMLFDRILWALSEQYRRSLIIIVMFPEISFEFSFC
jgi:hypothetical protein